MRIKLERPRLVSVEPEDIGWLVTIGDAMPGAAKPLIVARNIVGPGRTSITIPFDEPAQGALAERSPTSATGSWSSPGLAPRAA